MLKLKDLIKEEKCDCGCGGCETKLNESVDLPQGVELGKVFTGGGFAFKKEFDEGTCGYGVDGKLGKEPAGAHLIDKDDLEEIDDHEGSMAKSQLERSMKYSKMIYKIINNVGDGGEVKFPAWVQSKLTKSMDYLQSVYNYLDGKDGLEDKFQTEGKLTEKVQKYVVASTNGTLFSGDKGVTEKQALKIMDRYEKVGMNLFMLGVQYWNKPHKYNKKKIMVKEEKLTEAKKFRVYDTNTGKTIKIVNSEKAGWKFIDILYKKYGNPDAGLAKVYEGKLNEAKTLTLPNGVKAILDFKGITFKTKLSKPVFLDRDELLKFFKGSTKYLRYT